MIQGVFLRELSFVSDAVEEVRRYIQERGPEMTDSRSMYDQILREAKALEKMMQDDDVIIC